MANSETFTIDPILLEIQTGPMTTLGECAEGYPPLTALRQLATDSALKSLRGGSLPPEVGNSAVIDTSILPKAEKRPPSRDEKEEIEWNKDDGTKGGELPKRVPGKTGHGKGNGNGNNGQNNGS